MSSDLEYVLGTHDEEIARLGLQHRVWREHAHEAWRAAGFRGGDTILDVGCGPGYASLDLAATVGATGRVIAVDQSRRFLDALEANIHARSLSNVETVQRNLDSDTLPDVVADGAWVRWVFAFVRDPRALLEQIRDRLSPGGALAIHEYIVYASWRMMPPSADHDRFVRVVIDSWRRSGGEPDIGLALPEWLQECGFQVVAMRPIMEVVSPGDPKWQWAMAFVESGRRRLHALGELTAAECDAIGRAAAAADASPTARMITPAVLEIIARRS